MTGYVTLDKLELISLKTLPRKGPRNNRATRTTMATKTRINAYSTRPCPFSAGVNNMGLLLSVFIFPEFFRIH